MNSKYATKANRNNPAKPKTTQLKKHCGNCTQLRTTSCKDVLGCIKHNHRDFKLKENKYSTGRAGVLNERTYLIA